MRKKLPNSLNYRIKTRFLLFPKIIHRELRWLETSSWVEVYTPFGWVDQCWDFPDDYLIVFGEEYR